MGNYSNVECGMGNAGFWNLDFGFGIIRMLIAECGMRNGGVAKLEAGQLMPYAFLDFLRLP